MMQSTKGGMYACPEGWQTVAYELHMMLGTELWEDQKPGLQGHSVTRANPSLSGPWFPNLGNEALTPFPTPGYCPSPFSHLPQ